MPRERSRAKKKARRRDSKYNITSPNSRSSGFGSPTFRNEDLRLHVFSCPARLLFYLLSSTLPGARLSPRGHFERHGRALFVVRAYLRQKERVVVGPPFVPKPQTYSPRVRSSRCPPRASLRRLPSAPLPPPVARVRPFARALPPSKVRSLSPLSARRGRKLPPQTTPVSACEARAARIRASDRVITRFAIRGRRRRTEPNFFSLLPSASLASPRTAR